MNLAKEVGCLCFQEEESENFTRHCEPVELASGLSDQTRSLKMHPASRSRLFNESVVPSCLLFTSVSIGLMLEAVPVCKPVQDECVLLTENLEWSHKDKALR